MHSKEFWALSNKMTKMRLQNPPTVASTYWEMYMLDFVINNAYQWPWGFSSITEQLECDF